MDEVLHEIRMTDTWGDGWDETTLTITRLVLEGDKPGVLEKITTETTTTVKEIIGIREPILNDPSFPREIYSGGLEGGAEGFQYVCLRRNQCYQIATQGGLWPQEVAWGIRQVQLGVPREEADKKYVLAKGAAPETCQVSLANEETGERVCPITCGLYTEVPTAGPTFSTPVPTIIRGIMPNDVPSPPSPTAVSSVPSDAPSLIPTNVPSSLNVVRGRDDQDDEGEGDPKSGGKATAPPSDAPSLVPSGAPVGEMASNGFNGFGGYYGGFRGRA